MKDFLDLLARCVSGEQPFSVVEEWLAGIDWDDPDLTPDEKETFGLFELLTTEVSEEMRDQQELLSEATTLLTKQGLNVFLKDITVEVVIRASAVDSPDTGAIMIRDDQDLQTWSISLVLVV